MSLVANTGKLAGRTIFITGASRGIGKAIALKAAKDGANVVIAAKTADPHPKLPGTIYTAAEEIEALGGKALPCIVDVRDEKQIQKAIDEAIKKFNGIDILVNNASAISLTGTLETDMKRYDLMHNINTRGTFLTSKLCLPHLMKSDHAHILNLSPPLNMNPYWDPKTYTGNFAIDEDVVREAGVKDLVPYACDPKKADELLLDGFIDNDERSKSHNISVIRSSKRQYHTSTVYHKDSKDNTEAEGGKVSALFEAIGKNISPELVKKTQAVFQFNVKGAEEGVWHLDLKNGEGSCGQGEPKNPPDATLTMEGNNFADMFAGKLKPATAFMMGKLKIKGDMQKAMKLEKMMQSLKSKL
ncbi:Hydroxysteroid dehydrogenase-like protein 2 [Eumeta japonica]|uniref:Hydroxysteroid dehydrogenase-like protein 2 n=1 Tax=Eumeta variegata TaxID=151549 RepID=A0A4C1ZNK9_EUMVA|nr:Hydroxysteroid dehydrogenase-like protein 2 [Eumeta japonica]